MKQKDEQVYVSGPDVGRRWGVTANTARRLLEAHGCRPYRFGPGAVRYRLDEVLRVEREAVAQ